MIAEAPASNPNTPTRPKAHRPTKPDKSAGRPTRQAPGRARSSHDRQPNKGKATKEKGGTRGRKQKSAPEQERTLPVGSGVRVLIRQLGLSRH